MDLAIPRAADDVTRTPRKKSKNSKVVLAARVSEAEFDALKGLAARHRVTMTELLRTWLRTLDTYQPAPPRRSHRRE